MNHHTLWSIGFPRFKNFDDSRTTVHIRVRDDISHSGMNDDIRELINQKATVRQIRKAASEAGMKTLRQDGIEKAKLGLTTLDEVLRVTQTGF